MPPPVPLLRLDWNPGRAFEQSFRLVFALTGADLRAESSPEDRRRGSVYNSGARAARPAAPGAPSLGELLLRMAAKPVDSGESIPEPKSKQD